MTLLRLVIAILIVVSALISPTTSLAASLAQIDAAKSVLSATEFERHLKSRLALPNMGIPALDRLLEQARQNPEFLSLRNRATEAIPKISDQVAEIYANNFGEAELAALTEFFRSPIGHKYVTLLPEIQSAEAKLLIDQILKSDPKFGESLEADRRLQAQFDAIRANLEQQAKNGNPNAMYAMGTGNCSSPNLSDVKECIAKRSAWKMRAAESGLAQAQFDVGFSYIDGRDGHRKSGTEMLKWMKRAADQGHPGAMFYVGSAYAGNIKAFGNQPTGVEVNAKDAEFWLQKAAKAGGMGAIMDLALMYLEGRVVERNIPQAIHWYSQAAEKGNTFAMRKLGEMHERGIDMEPNPQEAMKWYKQAAGVPR